MHVELYTWSTCSFCQSARELLERHDVGYSEQPLDGDRARVAQLSELFGQLTMPFVLIDGEPLGGLPELERLAAQGGLGPARE